MSTDRSSHIFKSPVEALFGEDFNLGLFLHISRKNAIWVVLLTVICFGVITIYLRYQVPVYQATSYLLLKKNESPNLIDIEVLLKSDDPEAIQQEIEIMKSSRFIKAAISKMPLDLSLFKEGRILTQQYYRNEPFDFDYIITDTGILDIPIYFKVLNEREYELHYDLGAGEEIRRTLKFDREYILPHFYFKISLLSGYANNLAYDSYYFQFNDRNRLSREVASSITVALANYDANKIAVSFRSYNKRFAMDIVNHMARAMIDYEYRIKAESASLVIGFLDRQIDTLSDELFKQENALRTFKESNKLTNPVTEESYLRGQYLTLVERKFQLSLEETTLDWLEAYLEDTSNNIATILPPRSEFIDFSAFVNQIGLLQEKRAQLLISVREEDPRVLMLNRQIDQVKQDFRDGLVSARKKLQINTEYLDDQIEENDLQFSALPRKEAEFLRLTRLNEIKEGFYLMLLERRSEFEIARAGLVSDYVLLDRAVGTKLITTEKPILQAAGAFFGLFLGFGLIVFRYMFHNTITSLRDLEKFSMATVLGVVPRYSESLEHPSLVITNSPKSLISEAFRSLRTNIDFMVEGKDCPLVTITSTISGEGKTFIIANLGLVYTLLNKRVVIVDFDMRKPKLHKAMELENLKGSSTIISGRTSVDECIQRTGYDNLFVITSGPIPPNPSELIASEAAEDLIRYLQANFDLVLIDTPPLGLVADAKEVLSRVDVPIYVVRANYSNRNFVKNINDLVTEGKIGNLTTILNDAGMGGTSYGAGGYGLGYGYSYGYGYGYRYRNNYEHYGYGYYTDAKRIIPWWKRIAGRVNRS